MFFIGGNYPFAVATRVVLNHKRASSIYFWCIAFCDCKLSTKTITYGSHGCLKVQMMGLVRVNEKESERQAFSSRLKDTLRHTGRTVSPTGLAQEFNLYHRGPKVHMHSCRKWLQAESIPTQEKLVILARMLGVAPDWLRYGVETTLAREPGLNAYVPDPADLSLLAAIQQLSKRDKQVVQSLILQMLKINPPQKSTE